MSTHTIATLPRISASTLSELLLEGQDSNLDALSSMDGGSRIAVIDVRDDGMFHFVFVLFSGRCWVLCCAVLC